LEEQEKYLIEQSKKKRMRYSSEDADNEEDEEEEGTQNKDQNKPYFSGGIITIYTGSSRDRETWPRFDRNAWQYPKTKIDQVRYSVYLELWQKGYYISSALKFGGDFLVYPDDPLQYHAHYIVIVLQSPDVNINVLDIISWGRMGLTVRKSPVIASLDNN